MSAPVLLAEYAASPLHRCEAVLLRELVCYGGQVARERLIDALYGADPEGGPLDACRNIRVYLFRLRAKMRPEWRIDAAWGQGYRLARRAAA